MRIPRDPLPGSAASRPHGFPGLSFRIPHPAGNILHPSFRPQLSSPTDTVRTRRASLPVSGTSHASGTHIQRHASASRWAPWKTPLYMLRSICPESPSGKAPDISAYGQCHAGSAGCPPCSCSTSHSCRSGSGKYPEGTSFPLP